MVAYALSPIDLIPDPIPVLGYLDDLILLPAGVWLVMKLIPAPVWEECTARVSAGEKPRFGGRWLGAAIVMVLWVLTAYFTYDTLWRPYGRASAAGPVLAHRPVHTTPRELDKCNGVDWIDVEQRR